MPELIHASSSEQDPLPTNVSFYAVWVPQKLRDAAGNLKWDVAQPFQFIGQATGFASDKPGSKIMVCTIVHTTDAIPLVQSGKSN